MSKGKMPENMQRQTLQGCTSKSKEIAEDVEIIDLDSNNADTDVEIIDVDQPGTSHQGPKFVKKERGNSPNYVISIDDDDDEEEQNDETGSGSHARYGTNSRNRYGLHVTSESESFTDDSSEEEESTDEESSDCEMVDEESSGRIREEWERANSRKRNSDLNKVFGDAFDDNFGEKIGSFYSSRLDKDKDKNKAGPSCSNIPKPQEVNLDNINISLDDNLGEKIGSFYSTGLDKDKGKAGPSCTVPKPQEPNLKPSNNDENIGSFYSTGLDREKTGPSCSVPKCEGSDEKEDEFDISGEFESFNPCMFFEDELNKVVDSVCDKEEQAKETKFKKQFGMSSCSDNKRKSCSKQEEEDTFKKKENSSLEKDPCFIFGNGSKDESRNGEGSLIGEREKHKESDEYKLAVEAEWASRQQQLRIQGEEAQRLKRESKRRKAESLRLIDMEKRQKQRLEEIRETQKKNEETMSLKEELRAKVRKDLEIIERKYRDMPSILRGLGIPVSGGLSPLPTQIKAAYKQALLRFHPDRVQGSDIHQLVQAEETFKFISRFKDKLVRVS